MSTERIAIVGIGLRYPDAASTEDLWENVLAGRRAFRRLPDERMNQADYYSPDQNAPDRFYAKKAAVLRDFEFDRLKYKVAGSTFRSTDLTHWLALDVAATALADAGFPDAEGLPRAGHRRGLRQQPHRRVLPRQPHAAALAVRAAHARRRAGREGLGRRRDQRVPA